ncbi:MAG: carboxymuconolactone decarboxylase family protein [Gemmatimonadota bacterium]|nr:carboxymuconolactone decarboxylase family protein [Gemmatimonadota bacterium]
MTQFPVHTTETAPDEARSTLEGIRKEFGFVPNLFGEMADAPPVLDAYMRMDELFERTSLDSLERSIVRLTASRANECEYCIAAHSAELASQDFPREQIEILRNLDELPDERLEALRAFTELLVKQRGHASDEQIEAFLDAGFERRQVFEVVLGVSLKTLSNYVNHLADTPVDEPFADFAWTEEVATAGAAV